MKSLKEEVEKNREVFQGLSNENQCLLQRSTCFNVCTKSGH